MITSWPKHITVMDIKPKQWGEREKKQTKKNTELNYDEHACAGAKLRNSDELKQGESQLKCFLHRDALIQRFNMMNTCITDESKPLH